ncbi:hypothetical protein CIP107534_00268 [Corynebacterium diphtheriae]|nr:hypothetical protein CIP107521_00313 [Corynebacterium diphtheriae]CAB0543908.1 hypothetical protein CIP107534_00268 [Corynebacterium diphtheriae]
MVLMSFFAKSVRYLFAFCSLRDAITCDNMQHAAVVKQKETPARKINLNCSPLVGLRNQLPTSGEQLYACT